MGEGSDEQLRRIAQRSTADGGGSGGGRGRLVAGLLLLVLAVGGALAVVALRPAADGALEQRALAWYLRLQADDLQPASADTTAVSFEVAPGEGVAEVAQRLAAVGLIRDAGAFRLLARVRGLDTGVQAGAHELRRDMTAEEVLAALQVALGQGVRVTIPEGRRAEEVADTLAGVGLVERGEFLRLVGQGLAAGPAVADRPAGAGLEGYLFPDTYELEPEAGAEAVLRRLLATFEERFSPHCRRRRKRQASACMR